MASKEIYHLVAKTSWWNGTYTSYCGLTSPRKGSRTPWFPASVTKCPACLAVYAANGGK
ncbi:hypothetical protein ACFXPA_26330 [Amycolatopsis sp. NPDC059090]|uniref:hypothetical protein n=1 Tax=unclassified Amycolatopsis TaxID=2618356 RepID=UPI00366BCFCC